MIFPWISSLCSHAGDLNDLELSDVGGVDDSDGAALVTNTQIEVVPSPTTEPLRRSARKGIYLFLFIFLFMRI